MSTAEDLIGELQSNPDAVDALVRLISDDIVRATSQQHLDNASHNLQQRWMNSGVPVVTDNATTPRSRDVTGEAYFDVINIIGGQGVMESTNPRQLNLSLGGGADCLFDYLVSSCFATLAGFTEGQSFTSLSGCTFKGYSTVKGAATQATIDYPPSQTIIPTIAICGGTYQETGIVVAGRQNWIGAGRKRTIIENSSTDAGVDCVSVTTVSQGGKLFLSSLTINGSTNAGATAGGVKLSTSCEIRAIDCEFGSSGVAQARAGVHAGGVQGVIAYFTHCTFPSGKGLSITGNDSSTNMANCRIDAGNGIDIAEDSDIGNCRFTSTITAVTIAAVSSDVQVHDCHFLNCATGIVTDSTITTGDSLQLVDNHFDLCVIGIDLEFVNNAANTSNNIADNHFNATTTPIKFAAAASVMSGWCHGNVSSNTAMFTGAFPVSMRVWDNWTNSVAAVDQYQTNGLQGLVSPHGINSAQLDWPKFYVLFGGTRVSVTAGNFSYVAAGTFYVSVNSSGTVTANGGSFPATEYPLAVVTTTSIGKITAIDYYDSTLNFAVATGGAGGSAASAAEPYVTIGNTAGLTAERALTAGSGISITDGGANSTVTISTSGVVTAEHHTLMGVVDNTVVSTTVPYVLVGPLAAAATITAVEAMAGSNVTCGATSGIYDIHKIPTANKNTDGQGTTIFTTQANRPTISNGNRLSTLTLPDVVALAAGDMLVAYVDQSGTSLLDVTVSVRVTMP